MQMIYDQSVFIGQAIREVRNAALLGGLLAVLVVYAFLRNGCATFTIGVRHTGFGDRDLFADGPSECDAEHHVAGRHRAGHRHAGGQQHRRAREHRAQKEQGHVSVLARRVVAPARSRRGDGRHADHDRGVLPAGVRRPASPASCSATRR
jgi:hypothetical protein